MDGMELQLKMDEKENIQADAKMWRLSIKDKQAILKEGCYQPLISSDFQNIIGNPKIEEVCSKI